MQQATMELTTDQVREYLNIFIKKEANPTLPILLGMLVMLDLAQDNSTIQHWHKIFSESRVRQIMQAVIKGETDERINCRLQKELNKLGEGKRSLTPFWRYYSGWLKWRIICCFENLPEDKNTLLLYRKIKLEDLIKLPLRANAYKDSQKD